MRADLSLSVLRACKSAVDERLKGVVVYGSHVSESHDQWSDVDIICFTADEESRRIEESLSGTVFEIEVISIQDALSALDPKHWRENFILLALHTGIVIHDDNGFVEVLKSQAETLWAGGTGPLSQRECSRMHLAAKKLIKAAVRVGLRLEKHSGVTDADLLLQAHLNALHQHMLLVYARAFGQWFYPPWVMAKLPDRFYADLSLRVLEICREPSFAKKGRGIARLGEEAATRLASLLSDDAAHTEFLNH